jgi:hypothetical protein
MKPKKEEVKVKVEVEDQPQKMSFEEMKKSVEEFKRLQKIVKSIPKEEREKLLPSVHKREIPEALISMSEVIFSEIEKFKTQINEIFENSISTEKPEGNKSISLSSEDCSFSIAIIRTKKSKK